MPRRTIGLVVVLGVIAGGAGGLAACDRAPDPAGAPASRTDVAKVATGQAVSTDAFCDLHTSDAAGQAFHWPELAGGASAPAPPATWRWVNIWATWCKPCIEEMPRLLAWRDKLAAAGKQVELTFVSVDDTDAEVTAFRAAHPSTPPTLRITNAATRTAWLKTFGLDDGAIPIQLFVSAANKLRCARAGGIREKDYAVVDKLLGE
ncbi:MAG TPA: TlpA disulfide reductase family protein [Kofleriaceae bacterium]|nr:TlpA disulfide reductase family protein [Kofleriaceae bacterium]